MRDRSVGCGSGYGEPSSKARGASGAGLTVQRFTRARSPGEFAPIEQHPLLRDVRRVAVERWHDPTARPGSDPLCTLRVALPPAHESGQQVLCVMDLLADESVDAGPSPRDLATSGAPGFAGVWDDHTGTRHYAYTVSVPAA